MAQTFIHGASVRHTACSTPLHVERDFLVSAGVGDSITCSQCGMKLNSWDLLLDGLRDRSDLWHGVGFAGGQTIMIVETIQRNESFRLQLEPYGVSEQARLIRVSSTPQPLPGGVQTPGIPFVMTLIHQNYGAPLAGNELFFWPAEITTQEATAWSHCEVAFHVVWSEQSPTDDPWQLLRSALTAYADVDYVRAILDAVNAVDWISSAALLPILETEGYKPGRALGSIVDRVAFGNAFARAHGASVLCPRILTLMQKLNAARNREGIAHPGSFNRSADEVAELLAAALVATAYFEDFSNLIPDLRVATS